MVASCQSSVVGSGYVVASFKVTYACKQWTMPGPAYGSISSWWAVVSACNRLSTKVVNPSFPGAALSLRSVVSHSVDANTC